MKKISKLFSIFSIFITPFVTSCSSTQSFYLANYESYISDSLLSQLESEFSSSNFSYRTYSTNEDLERNFLTNYDVAIPSLYLAAKYANEGKLLPIDWKSFNLYKLDENGIQTTNLIENASDALSLFTPQAQNQLKAYWLDDAFKIDEISEINQEAGLLNYCVPYFLQDVSFGFNLSLIEKEISNLNWNEYNNYLGNLNNSLKHSWNDVINYLYKKTNDGSLRERTAVVDDYSTLYSIARIMQTENSNKITVNPDYTESNKLQSYEGNLSIEQAFDTLKYLFNFNKIKKKNAILLNSDSNTLLNDFAKDFSQAIISYNGDLLYAMQGGDDNNYFNDKENFQNWITKNLITIKENKIDEKRDFKLKLIKPEATLSVMDCMVINKNLTTKKGTIETAHEVIKKIGLEGSDLSLYESKENKVYSKSENIFSVDEEDEYIYGPMLNFDYVNYTSPLLTINAYVMNSSSDLSRYESEQSYNSFSTLEQSNGYFTDLFSWINQDDEESKNGFLSEEEY
ncbi:MAG: hypothetical protein K2H51_02745, partial [Malacoplasma sp.]|nr:hypothetical protein [Malacoplasma sp.]